MQLDIRTLLVAVVMASAFSAAALVILWRLHRTMPGLAHWAWVSVMAAEREVAQAQRSGEPLAALMMDLDHSKQINDRLGHAFGDDVLHHFAALAAGLLRDEDIFSRFGGEEFVVLLPRSNALAVAERVRESLCVRSRGWGGDAADGQYRRCGIRSRG